jgi:DNA invertase Pin-like site-specific DNA recombinase
MYQTIHTASAKTTTPVPGLGLAAQRDAVETYLNGGRWSFIAEFTEVESGKHNDRPELEKAVTTCKKQRAKLVIAKLDRLSRNLAFIATLMDSGVEFVAVARRRPSGQPRRGVSAWEIPGCRRRDDAR